MKFYDFTLQHKYIWFVDELNIGIVNSGFNWIIMGHYCINPYLWKSDIFTLNWQLFTYVNKVLPHNTQYYKDNIKLRHYTQFITPQRKHSNNETYIFFNLEYIVFCNSSYAYLCFYNFFLFLFFLIQKLRTFWKLLQWNK